MSGPVPAHSPNPQVMHPDSRIEKRVRIKAGYSLCSMLFSQTRGGRPKRIATRILPVFWATHHRCNHQLCHLSPPGLLRPPVCKDSRRSHPSPPAAPLWHLSAAVEWWPSADVRAGEVSSRISSLVVQAWRCLLGAGRAAGKWRSNERGESRLGPLGLHSVPPPRSAAAEAALLPPFPALACPGEGKARAAPQTKGRACHDSFPCRHALLLHCRIQGCEV